MAEWQPIETAPKDGTRIIVRGAFESGGRPPMQAAVAQWDYYLGLWMRDNNGCGFTVQCWPTHWMPIPAASET